MIERGRYLVLTAICLFPTGCSAPIATLDLLTVARKGIASARQDLAARSGEAIRHLERQKVALDTAFDADVGLAAAGQIKDADGQPVELTSEWVISARKGYAAARDILAGQIRASESAHATELDNLDAADESLEMASQLIVSRWDVSERLKQHFLSLQRRFLDE